MQCNYLKYSFLAVVGIFVVVLYFLIDPNEVDFLPKCPLYAVTGLYCPGCGSQRATHALLHFDLLGMLRQNLFYVLGLIIIGYHILITVLNKLLSKKYYNYLYHPYTPKFILAGILIFWGLRNIPLFPFTLLAPK